MFVGILRDVTEGNWPRRRCAGASSSTGGSSKTAQEGVWVHDLEGRTTFVNTAWLRCSATLSVELEGRRLLEFVAPELEPNSGSTWNAGGRGSARLTTSSFAATIGRSLGDRLGKPPEGRRGRVIGVLKMITDITDAAGPNRSCSPTSDDSATSPQIFRSGLPVSCSAGWDPLFSYVSPRTPEFLNLAVPLDSADWTLGTGVHPDDR